MQPARLLLAAFAFLGALLAPGRAGPELLLYPFARAFGGPSEAELVKCRAAFARLRTELPTSDLVVHPVLVRSGGSSQDDPEAWRTDLAHDLSTALRSEGVGAGFEVRASVASVGRTPFGRNQLRYLWSRAAEYGRCLRASHPPGEYFLFVEVFGRGDAVGAIQVFVYDSAGQLAYCRLFNSHHFGNRLPRAGDGALRLVARRLREDLRLAPEEMFPPYGVG